MAEAADGDQHDGDIGVAGNGNEGQRNHQKGAGHRTGDDGVNPGIAEPAGIQSGQIAADDAAEVGGKKRQPGEHGNLFQIHAVLFSKVQRDPKAQHGPGRFGHERRNRDTVKTLVFRDGF